jgi:hypothetical protein
VRSTRSGAGRASRLRRVVAGPPCRWQAPAKPAARRRSRSACGRAALRPRATRRGCAATRMSHASGRGSCAPVRAQLRLLLSHCLTKRLHAATMISLLGLR